MRKEYRIVIKKISTNHTKTKLVSYTPEQIKRAYEMLNVQQGDYMIMYIKDEETE